MPVVIKGIDCMMPIGKTVADRLAAEGYKFVCRYLPGEYKRLTADEIQVLTDAGLLILAVYETTAERAKGGAANGKADGADALQLARKLRMPEHGCICFTVDYDARNLDPDIEHTNMDTVEAYLRAAKAQVGKYKAYVYGGYAVVEDMARRDVCDGYWQAYAWSDGNISVHNMARQISTPQAVAGISADLDEAYSFRGLWNYNTTAEAIALADELELSSPDYWGKVFQGKAALKPEYLKALLQKASGYGVNKLFENVI